MKHAEKLIECPKGDPGDLGRLQRYPRAESGRRTFTSVSSEGLYFPILLIKEIVSSPNQSNDMSALNHVGYSPACVHNKKSSASGN